jgi:hypothetical protein
VLIEGHGSRIPVSEGWIVLHCGKGTAHAKRAESGTIGEYVINATSFHLSQKGEWKE